MAKIAQPKKRETSSKASALTSAEKQQVERLAYQFFVERGFQHGFDQEDWQRAETIIRNKKLS